MRKPYLSLVIMFILIFPNQIVASEYDDLEKPEPNIYKEKEIDININLRDRIKSKERISEKQQLLILDLNNKSNEKSPTEQLSLTTIENNETVMTKSEKVGLFTEMDHSYIASGNNESDRPSSSIIFYVFIGIGLIVLVLLVRVIAPKLESA